LQAIPSKRIGSPQTRQHGRRFERVHPNDSSPHGITGTSSFIAIVSAPGVHLSRVAEPLPCPLDEDADDVSLADKLPRLA
jgi:hypothetical protein